MAGERSPSAGPRAAARGGDDVDESCRVARQPEGSAEDADVRDELPVGGRCDADGGRDAGAVLAGPRASQRDGYRGAGFHPGGVHLRARLFRGPDYSLRAWLINKTQITKGAAVAHTAWVRRAAAHPEVAQALAAGEISESFGRTLCLWTDKLPGDCREAADAILVGAAKTGMGLRDLAELAAEILARSRSDADGDSDDGLEDRAVKLLTTFQGAGVLTGDLTPQCVDRGHGAGCAVGPGGRGG